RDRQRRLAERSDSVMEGRDIGTVVVPGADVKVYLVADATVRAARRRAERPEVGDAALETDVRLHERDREDADRMQPAADAVEIVHATPGVTRDRKELVCEWNGKRFAIVDTGGVDSVDPSPIARGIVEQATAAIEESDLVLFVVDARAGITTGDEELAEILRRAKRPVIVLANKIDEPAADALAHEFHRLGLGEPVPLSAMHGHGTGDLLDEIGERLPGGRG